MFINRSHLFFICSICFSAFIIAHIAGHSHDGGHSHTSGHAHENPAYKYSKEANTNKVPTEKPEEIWLNTLCAVGLISIAPLVVLWLIPDLNKRRGLLKIFLGFAAGGLLGDAFFHLIPHAIAPHSHAHSHASEEENHSHHMRAGFFVVAGIVAFLFIEKLIRLIKGDDSGHGHSHIEVKPVVVNGKKKQSGDASKNKIVSNKIKQPFKVAGYLNLAADFTHNFTDGLAIGASFMVSRAVGISTTITVLIHELPHEIGDYAILIQSGCSARKAMLLQLTTAFGALFGAALSLLAAGIGAELFGSREFTALVARLALSPDAVTTTVLPFTAGGFLYIALASVLPDLLSQESGSSGDQGKNAPARRSFGKEMCQGLAEVLALCVGVGLTAAVELMH